MVQAVVGGECCDGVNENNTGRFDSKFREKSGSDQDGAMDAVIIVRGRDGGHRTHSLSTDGRRNEDLQKCGFWKA